MLKLMENAPKKSITRDAQRLESIPIGQIKPNPNQPRRVFNECSIEELSRSIREVGLLQPITVRKINTGYEIIAGERRLRACKKAGFTHINAVIVNAYEQESALLALIENLQRENLHFFEEAEGYQNIIKEHGFTQEELAKKVGKNQSTIANKLRLLRMSQQVRTAIVCNRLTERHARALLRIHDPKQQLELIEHIKKKSLSVQLTEGLIQKTLDKMFGEEKAKGGMRRVIRDGRILINSMKSVVDNLRAKGLDACMKVDEYDSAIEIHLLLPKQDVKPSTGFSVLG